MTKTLTVHQILKRHGIRQSSIAQKLKVDRSHVNRVIHGERESRRVLQAVSDETGVPFKTVMDAFTRQHRRHRYRVAQAA